MRIAAVEAASQLWKYKFTSSSAITERPRCRVDQFWPKVEDDIFQTIQPLWPAKLSNSVKYNKIRAITLFKVIQSHRRRYQSKDRMRLPINSN